MRKNIILTTLITLIASHCTIAMDNVLEHTDSHKAHAANLQEMNNLLTLNSPAITTRKNGKTTYRSTDNDYINRTESILGDDSSLTEIDWHKEFQLLYGKCNASISGDLKDPRNQTYFMQLYMGLSRFVKAKGMDTKLGIPVYGISAKALSISGGGIKGISPTEFLKAIEKNVSRIRKKPTLIKDTIHLSAGTSTGAIIASLISLPERKTMSEIQNLYFNNAKKIFDPYWFSFGGMFHTKYKSDGLLNLAYQTMGQYRLSDCTIPTIIPAYNLTTRSMQFFSSERAQVDERENYYMIDAVMSSGAAPAYFSPVLIYNLAKNKNDFDKGVNEDFFRRFKLQAGYRKWFGWGSYVPPKLIRRESVLDSKIYGADLRYSVMEDGGVNVNNPTMQTLVKVGKNWGPVVNEIVIINIGTGNSEIPIKYKDIKNAGAITHMKQGKLFEVMIDQDFVDSQADDTTIAYPYVKHFKLNVKLKDGTMDRTDPEFLEYLRDVTKFEINGNSKEKIKELSQILAKPRITLPSKLGSKHDHISN